MDIIKHGLVSLLLFLLWIKGQTDGSDVHQISTLWENKGDNATVECNHTKGGSYFQMYWYRHLPGENMELIVFTTAGNDDHDFGKSSKEKFSATKPNAESGTLIVKNLEPGDQGLYFCAVSQDNYEAYFGQGTKLTVLDPKRKITPPTVKVFQPSSKECRNLKDEKERKKTLLCVARDFYPDHVSIFWQVNAKNVTKGVATDPAARLDDKTYFITSRLRVHAEVWTSPGTNFSCFVTFFDGNKTIIKDETVFAVEAYVPSVKTRVKYLRSTQSFKLSYTVFIIKSSIYGAFVAFLVWKLQGSTGKQKY